MKIVIDIPEERYEFIKGLDNTCYDIHTAIAQGTLLTAGHGDLIDREYVESVVRAEFVDLQDGTEEWRTYVNDTCENILIKVHNAPTVIPTDK